MKTFYLILSFILIFLAIGEVALGFLTAQSAPQECVTVGSGCFIAILARIAQAAAHDCKPS